MNTEYRQLVERITAIEERNKRVELEKAWEGSAVRRVSIALLTYGLIAVYMEYIGVTDPWINAVVPTVGYLLSTMTLSLIKRRWMAKVQGKRRW